MIEDEVVFHIRYHVAPFFLTFCPREKYFVEIFAWTIFLIYWSFGMLLARERRNWQQNFLSNFHVDRGKDVVEKIRLYYGRSDVLKVVV